MSYSVDWITPIYDRTYNDVLIISADSTNSDTKGCFNAVDLNRIENNTKYVAEDMYARRIVRTPFSLSYKLNWQANEIPTAEDMARIVQNIYALMLRCNPVIENDLKPVYNPTQMTLYLANDLEYNLYLLKNQPNLPVESFLLTIEHGEIVGKNNPDYIEENEVATIRGVPYGENAQYMIFDHWSGNAEDLACLADTDSQTTTIEMPYRAVTLTAVFQTRIPRTLRLTNATINDAIGGTTRTVYAGDEIPILANTATSGKRMYEWTGTQAALELLTYGVEVASNILVMPDCDVNLAPRYINAGTHAVRIANPADYSTISSTQYEYNEYVTLSAPYKEHYEFSYWSGDTAYLSDINSSYNSFNMPDVNLTFYPYYRYVYGHHYVLAQNCLANGEEQLDNYQEQAYIDMSLTQDFQNTLSENVQFDCYFIYQLTDIVTDPQTGKITNYTATYYTSLGKDLPNMRFKMYDFDILISPGVASPVTLSVSNIDNNGQTTTYSLLPTRSVTLTTQSEITNASGRYRFAGWYKGDTLLSNNADSFKYFVGSTDTSIVAAYNYYAACNITLINKNNLGNTEILNYYEGYSYTIYSNEIVGNNIIDKWYLNGTEISDNQGKSYLNLFSLTSSFNNATIEITYRPRATTTLTIQDGHITDGEQTTYTALEGTSVSITANSVPPRPGYSGSFYKWNVISGWYKSISNEYARETTITLGRWDCTIAADYTYNQLYKLTTITSTGTHEEYNTANTYTQIDATPIPENYEFDRWEITSGSITFYGSQYNAKPWVITEASDVVLTAKYKAIPWYTCTIQSGGHFTDNTVTKTVLRNTYLDIVADTPPLGQSFLRWEVLSGENSDVNQLFAERTYISNITHNVVVRALYYTPGDTTQYSLSVTNKSGIVNTTTHTIAEEFQITADTPDTGYEFYKWYGDVQYLSNKYSSTTTVTMPNKNISLGMMYKRQGAIVLYHVTLSGGKMVIGTQGGEPIWDVSGEFEQGSVVRIKADPMPTGWEFYGWKNPNDNGASMSTVTNLNAEDTTLTVSNFDIDLTVDMVQEGYKKLIVNNGEISGAYEIGEQATIFFNKLSENTNTKKYTFTRWTGDTNLSLYGGGNFDIYDSGDFGEDPQIIVMPNRHVTITGEYTTDYKVTLTNATINNQGTQYIPENTSVTLQAVIPQNKVFKRWVGDTQYIDAIYSSSTTLTMPSQAITLAAEVEDENDQNGIGYVLTSIYNNGTINTADVNIISGTIEEGFMITDSKGHIYVITSVSNGTANITRITKKTGGTQNGQ